MFQVQTNLNVDKSLVRELLLIAWYIGDCTKTAYNGNSVFKMGALARKAFE